MNDGFTNLTKKYPELNTTPYNFIGGIEVFCSPPTVQKCGDIKILVNAPFTKIIFNKGEALLALLVASIKTQGIYSFAESFRYFINGEEIEIPFLDEIIEENFNFISFAKLLNDEKNCITIEVKNFGDLPILMHMLTYPAKEEDDDTLFNEELTR